MQFWGDEGRHEFFELEVHLFKFPNRMTQAAEACRAIGR